MALSLAALTCCSSVSPGAEVQTSVFCLRLATALCLFLQNTPTQNQDGNLQSELLPVHTSSPQTPPPEHMGQPASTVDTAALSEEPTPGEN